MDSTEASSLDLTTLSLAELAPVALGEYVCGSLEEVNSVLEAALRLVRTHKQIFLLPCLSQPAGSQSVTLSLTALSSLSPVSPSFLQLPKDNYLHVAKKGRRKLTLGLERLYEGWSATLNQSIDIAITHYSSLPACNSALQAAFISAGLKHENVCEVRAVHLYQGKAGVKMRVERQCTKRSLDTDLLERRQLRSFYAEVALLDLLNQACSVLMHAQQQGLQCNEVTPATVYIAAQGVYKLSGLCFSCGTAEGSDANLGVASLGRTLLQLAALDPDLQQDSALRKLPYSKSLKDLIRSMLRKSLTFAEVAQSLSLPSPPLAIPVTPADIPLAKFRAAKQLKSQRAYAQAATLFAEAWRGYLDRGDTQAAEVGVELVHLLAVQVCNFEEAKAVITHVNHLQPEMPTSSKLKLIEAAYFMEDYDQVECQTIALFATSLNLEQYLALCFYLTECYWSDGRKSEISQMTEYLAAQSAMSHLALHQLLLLHLQAREQESTQCWTAAAALRAQMQELTAEESCFPLGLLRAINAMDLALAYEDVGRQAEALIGFEQADNLLRLEYPVSALTGRNLYNWGNALRAVSMLDTGLEMYERAEEVFTKRHSTCLERGLALSNSGLGLAALHRLGEAGEKYARAEDLFSTHYPAYKERARNLMNWAVLFEQSAQFSRCLQLYESAHCIFSRLSPTSMETGLSLLYLGKALVECSRCEDAVEKLATAHSALTSLDNTSFLEQNVYYWGRALAASGRTSAALEKYKESYGLWAGVVDSAGAVERLVDWGNCLFSLGKYALAIEKYEAADTLLKPMGPSEASARNLYNWANALACYGLLPQAMDKHQQCHSLLLSLSPSALITAQNLLNWGRDLCEFKSFREAVKKLVSAKSLFKRKFPQSKDAGRNLMNLGVAWLQLRRSRKALKRHESAHLLFSTHYPNSLDTALNLLNWANALCSLQKFAVALEKFHTADAVLLSLNPTSKERGITLHNWGNALFDAGKAREACAKYREAEEVLRGKYAELEERNRERWKVAQGLSREDGEY